MTERRAAKVYRNYDEQVEILADRGMGIHDRSWAATRLREVNYYRLSGYWYPFRMMRADGKGRADTFFPGSDLRDVVALYDFDARLRSSAFTALAPIELAIRARLGHELGKIDPLIHLRPDLLGPTTRRSRSTAVSSKYSMWSQQYAAELARSREDFVDHHKAKYGGRLPIWAAVEILDWGKLTHLYGLSPQTVRAAVARDVGISAPQLESWLKSLNILRNYAAHHGRVFNRVFALTPKLPTGHDVPQLTKLAPTMNRAFGQLSLIQYLLIRLGVGNARILPTVLDTFPAVPAVPISHMGAPEGWRGTPLWNAMQVKNVSLTAPAAPPS